MGMVQANVKKMEKEVDPNLLGPNWKELQMSDVSEYIKARNLLKDVSFILFYLTTYLNSYFLKIVFSINLGRKIKHLRQIEKDSIHHQNQIPEATVPDWRRHDKPGSHWLGYATEHTSNDP